MPSGIYERKSKKIEIICQYCGEVKKVFPCRIKNGNSKYCSNKCKGLAQTGKNHPNFKGGKKVWLKKVCDKRKNSLKYQLNHRMSVGIWRTLKRGEKNGRTWLGLVPYTHKKLKKRLESTMPFGYTWQDFLDGKLHIDHIISISEFKFEKPEDLGFKRCWALSNLRLIPKIKNLIKKNRLIKSFQTNLNIAI